MRVSAVFPTLGRPDILEETLHILANLGEIDEAVVVANGPNPSEKKRLSEIAKKHEDFARFIFLEKNIGVSAYNIGFAEAQGKYILIMDDDSFPLAGTVSAAVSILERNPDIGILALDVRGEDHSADKAIPSEVDVKACLGFNGAGAVARKDVILRAGGYPDEFFIYFNEKDLTLRVMALGYKVCFAPGLFVIHKKPKKGISPRVTFFYLRNYLLFTFKYFSPAEVFRETVGALLDGLLCGPTAFIAVLDFLKLAASPRVSRLKVPKEIRDKLRVGRETAVKC